MESEVTETENEALVDSEEVGMDPAELEEDEEFPGGG